jgi:hypothetical protein
MPPAGFEPKISADERPQTDAIDRKATGTGTRIFYDFLFLIFVVVVVVVRKKKQVFIYH